MVIIAIWDLNVHSVPLNIFHVTLYLKNGLTIVKMGKTDTSGNYEINNVPVLDTDGDGVEDPYTIVPKRNGYFFTPETQEVDSSSPMADFEATSEW